MEYAIKFGSYDARDILDLLMLHRNTTTHLGEYPPNLKVIISCPYFIFIDLRLLECYSDTLHFDGPC